MGEFDKTLESFKNVRALVVGDLMLDEYVFGTASRISPEAPVMVIRQDSMRHVPGGAANVAKNIAALGGSASVVGIVGDDDAGRALQDSLSSLAGVSHVTKVEPDRVTTRKTRIVADHSHQVLRVDNETTLPISDHAVAWLLDQIESNLSSCDVIVLSDYLKGVMTEQVVSRTIQLATTKDIPVVANPKPSSAAFYRSACLLSLNRAEARMLLGVEVTADSASDVADAVRAKVGCEMAVVTLGDQGMVAAGQQETARVNAPKVEVYDTAGAGDTVIATLALCIANSETLARSLALAAETSSRVVRHVGVAVPTPEDIAAIMGL